MAASPICLVSPRGDDLEQPCRHQGKYHPGYTHTDDLELVREAIRIEDCFDRDGDVVSNVKRTSDDPTSFYIHYSRMAGNATSSYRAHLGAVLVPEGLVHPDPDEVAAAIESIRRSAQ